MDEKLTPWFSAKVSPVRKGVYQVSETGSTCFAYWDGLRFGYRIFLGDANLALKMREHSTCLPSRQKWRGLASDPKASKP